MNSAVNPSESVRTATSLPSSHAGLIDRAERHRQFVGLHTLRGSCCLVVVIHHCLMALENPEDKGLFFHAMNAHAAIIVFFVLSGFVLSMSRIGNTMTPGSLLNFYIVRLARIYPALVFSGLCYILVYKLVLPWPVQNQASDWLIRATDPDAMPPRKIVQAFLGFSTSLQPPLWTIAIEIAVSIILPALWLFSRGRAGLTCLLGLTLALSFLNIDTPFAIHVYLFPFVVGIAASVAVRSGLAAATVMPARRSAVLLVVLGLALFSARYLLGYGLEADYNAPFPGAVESLLAGLLIVVIAMNDKTLGMLANPLFRWLGDISYSVYLMHFAAIVLVLYAVDRFVLNVSAAWLTLACLAVTLPVSTAIFRLIEQPALKAVRRRIRR